MDDLDLDRELRNAMAATPSPEFVARVRAKIAEAPAPSIVPVWMKPAAAIACAAAVAIAVGLPQGDARLKPRPTEIAPATAGLKPSTTHVAPSTTYVAPRTTDVPPTTPSVVVPTFRSAKAARRPSPARKEPPLPEVIIAAEDVKALRQFVSDARALRFVASFDETPPSTRFVMNDLAVPPITIEPLYSAPARNN
jgi:hypothetical protein